MKGKVSKNKFLKVVLPALLVVAIICQAVGFQAVLAKGNVATTSSDSISNLTDQQLQALTNPILQSYKADSSHKVWKMTDDSRLAVLANQTNIENARLQEVVKLVNSEFMQVINMSLISFKDMFSSIIFVYMLLGIGIGVLGSMISMRKYLKV